MAVTTSSPAPYAPPSAVIEVVNRYRARGLPQPISSEVLGRAGVSESLIPRTLQALQSLDLIDDKGMATKTLEGLRLASEGEFKARMLDWLNGAYADVLNFVDPAAADEVAVRDAFRTYNPVGQQPRMVTLFMGLYSAAGVGPDRAPSQSRPSRPTNRSANNPRSKPAGKPDARRAQQEQHYSAGGLPPALAGLLAQLPEANQGWTKERRDRFLITFGSVLDFCFAIVTEDELDEEGDGDAE